jgi:hypothetical protein
MSAGNAQNAEMAKNSKSTRSAKGSYKVVGRTRDGVYVLAPKTKATHFTPGEIRAAITEVRQKKGEFVARRSDGRFDAKSLAGSALTQRPDKRKR